MSAPANIKMNGVSFSLTFVQSFASKKAFIDATGKSFYLEMKYQDRIKLLGKVYELSKI